MDSFFPQYIIKYLQPKFFTLYQIIKTLSILSTKIKNIVEIHEKLLYFLEKYGYNKKAIRYILIAKLHTYCLRKRQYAKLEGGSL